MRWPNRFAPSSDNGSIFWSRTPAFRKRRQIEDTTVADFDDLFAVNVRAPYFLVQQLLPVMCKGSSVVLLSSLAARAAVGTLPAYAATKGAVIRLSSTSHPRSENAAFA